MGNKNVWGHTPSLQGALAMRKHPLTMTSYSHRSSKHLNSSLQTNERKRLASIFKAKAKTDKINFLFNMADKAADDFSHNWVISIFKAIRTLASGNHLQVSHQIVSRADGMPSDSTDKTYNAGNNTTFHLSTFLLDPCRMYSNLYLP